MPALVPSSVFGADAPVQQNLPRTNRLRPHRKRIDLPGLVGAKSLPCLPAGASWPASWPCATSTPTAWPIPRRAWKNLNGDGVAVKTFGDYREMLADARNRRRRHQHAGPLARPTGDRRRPRRQGRLCAEAAGHDPSEGRQVSDSVPTKAPSKSAASNAPIRPGPSSAAPANWSATGASAASAPSASACPRTLSAATPRPYARAAQPQLPDVARLHPRAPYTWTASTRRIASPAVPAGCASKPIGWA